MAAPPAPAELPDSPSESFFTIVGGEREKRPNPSALAAMWKPRAALAGVPVSTSGTCWLALDQPPPASLRMELAAEAGWGVVVLGSCGRTGAAVGGPRA